MNISVLISYGETNFRTDLQKCNSSQIIIGTQGRLFNMIKRKQMGFNSVDIIVIDAGGGLQRNELDPVNANTVLGQLNKNART